MTLVLASGSPRRRELLSRLRVEFEVRVPDVDETRLPDEQPGQTVERLAKAKAEAVAAPGLVVLAADTLVVHDGHVLGKPAHPEEARFMLRRLSGDRHEVFTGVAVCGWEAGPRTRATVDVAEVVFASMTEEEIADYVESGEPMDKAGAYALQGAGGMFVEAVHGSPFTVIGLPLHLLSRLLASQGFILGPTG